MTSRSPSPAMREYLHQRQRLLARLHTQVHLFKALLDKWLQVGIDTPEGRSTRDRLDGIDRNITVIIAELDQLRAKEPPVEEDSYGQN